MIQVAAGDRIVVRGNSFHWCYERLPIQFVTGGLSARRPQRRMRSIVRLFATHSRHPPYWMALSWPSIKNAEEDVRDDRCSDRYKDEVRTGYSPLVARINGEPRQHRGWHHLLGDSWGQWLTARQVLANTWRQRTVTGKSILECVTPGGGDGDTCVAWWFWCVQRRWRLLRCFLDAD